MASVVLLWNRVKGFHLVGNGIPGSDAGQGTQWIWLSLVWWGEGSFSSRRSHFPNPLYHPLLCASLCFSVRPVQLFLHCSGRGVREFTWQGQGSRALQCRGSGQESHSWHPCQKSPSGPATLSSRAVGRGRGARDRVKMKDSVAPSLHRAKGLLPDCQELRPSGWQLQHRPWTGFTQLHEEIRVQ